MFNNNKPIEFPLIKSLNDLFESPLTPNKTGNERYVAFSSFNPHKKGGYGYLRPEFEQYIQERMLNICNDPNIYIEVIKRSDESYLITFQYNLIIGSRWITEFDKNHIF